MSFDLELDECLPEDMGKLFEKAYQHILHEKYEYLQESECSNAKFKLASAVGPASEFKDFVEKIGEDRVEKDKSRHKSRVLFLFQKDSESGEWLVILGLLIDEYITVTTVTDRSKKASTHLSLYLNKLDSTAQTQPIKFQHILIAALVKSYVDYQRLSYPHSVIHLVNMSKSNPEYLFPLSSNCDKKRILPGRKLAYWWFELFNQLFASDCVEKCWLIPGIEKSMIPFHQRTSSDQFKWKYGFPYNKQEVANDCIPNYSKFGDDSKSKCLSRCLKQSARKNSNHPRDLSVSSFFQLLESSSDFVNGDIGIFNLEFFPMKNGAEKNLYDIISKFVCENADSQVKFKDILYMLNVKNDPNGKISPVTFETRAKCFDSSQKLAKTLRIEINKEDFVLELPENITRKSSDSNAATVNNLLPVRKRTSQTQQVNLLSVKRKAPRA